MSNNTTNHNIKQLQNEEPITNKKNNKFECDKCTSKFTTKFALNRHLSANSCKIKNMVNKPTSNNGDVIELLIKIQENQKNMEANHLQEISNLKNTIIDLQSKIKSDTTNNINSNNNTTNNITNNIVNNITLKFGEEKASEKLSLKEIQWIMSAHYSGVLQRSIEMTHFSNKYPLFQNIFIPDKKMLSVNVFNGYKFDLQSAEIAIKELLRNHTDYLDDYINRDDVSISDKKKKEFDEIVDNFLKYDINGSDSQKKFYDSVVSDVKLSLYNNKEKVISTHKRSKSKLANRTPHIVN